MHKGLVLVLVFGLTSVLSAAQLVPPLTEIDFEQGYVNVMVTLKRPDFGVALSGDQKLQVAQLIDLTLLSLQPEDFTLAYRYQTFAGFSGKLSQNGLNLLAQNSEVEFIEIDQKATAFLAESIPLIRVDSVQALGYTGQGCVVGILDTGIDSLHSDFDGAIVTQQHFLFQGSDAGYGAWDGNGHGTRVAGIIASDGVISPVGVAPDAQIVAVKILDDSGSGYFSDIAMGLDWIAANNSTFGVDVINMSLGGGLFSAACDVSFPTVKSAIDACRAAGIAVFVASGNDGKKTRISAPACITGAFSVGAFYDDTLGREPDTLIYNSASCYDSYTAPFKLACFSNLNVTLLSITAPGSWITSSSPGNSVTGGWGTSFATPHCAGVALLLCEMDSTISADSILQLMRNTGGHVVDSVTGTVYKRLDALSAVTGCLWVPGDANGSGTLNLSDVISTVNYIFNKPDWPACFLNTSFCWLGEFACRGDWNADGAANLSDVIRGVNLIFDKPGGPWAPSAIAACCQPVP